MPGIKIRSYYALTFFSVVIFSSCSVQQQIGRRAQVLIHDPLLAQAHTGISIFEPATGRYWYNYQADKLFVPASNTKIPTCYAAMKYLGDSLPAIEYAENDTAIFLFPTGDPTFLHPDFKYQPLFNFLKNTRKKLFITEGNWNDNPMGSGWPWDDYNDDYAVERNGLPVYGNLIKWVQTQTLEKPDGVNEQYIPSVFSEPEVSWEVNFDAESKDSVFFVKRKRDENSYTIYQGKEKYIEQQVPFVTAGIQTAISLLKDTVGKEITITTKAQVAKPSHRIYSQPVDSFLTPMMHHSDNFFAEQAVLMVSNKILGVMNDRQILDTLLKTDFKDLPQRPHWVDGSGLSHYDLFSPMDFIFILNKMSREFGLKRVEAIFPTGGTGTLKNFYRQDSGFLFAKTGTLSGVVTLSGYLHTSKNKLLLFSILVNNREAGGADIRRVVERFLQEVRNKY